MKYLNFTLIILLSFAITQTYAQVADSAKKPAFVFVENGTQVVDNGKIYRSDASGASRNGNGNNNGAFGNMGHWSVDMMVSERTPNNAATQLGNFKDNTHPLYQGQDVLTHDHGGMGALGWGSFTANAYNRASGTGSVAMGFHNIAGTNTADTGPFDTRDENNGGQAVFGRASRATGPVSFASGYRNTASGQTSVAMGNYNYATGASSIAIGQKSYAEGANAVAIGYQSHAAGAGSTALGQENVSWGTTNFTAGYKNTAGDTNAAVGSGGSAVAMGKNNTASADASMALNRATTASNQAATSMGYATTADNVGMLAIGVNNAAGIGNTVAGGTVGSYHNTTYNGGPPEALGLSTGGVGVAFVIGNGDVDVTVNSPTDFESPVKGANPSNAFVVKYDGSATLAGDLTVNSDARLKSNIVSLGNTLAKLMQIDGKSYTMKSNEKENKIGLLAQEILEVFPELVKSGMDKNETLSVNYQGLIPVLINAIKEQQEELKFIKKSVNEDK
jgi:hypothetical protein